MLVLGQGSKQPRPSEIGERLVLLNLARTYGDDVWNRMPPSVTIKLASLGVNHIVNPVPSEWDVPVQVSQQVLESQPRIPLNVRPGPGGGVGLRPASCEALHPEPAAKSEKAPARPKGPDRGARATRPQDPSSATPSKGRKSRGDAEMKARLLIRQNDPLGLDMLQRSLEPGVDLLPNDAVISHFAARGLFSEAFPAEKAQTYLDEVSRGIREGVLVSSLKPRCTPGRLNRAQVLGMLAWAARAQGLSYSVLVGRLVHHVKKPPGLPRSAPGRVALKPARGSSGRNPRGGRRESRR